MCQIVGFNHTVDEKKLGIGTEKGITGTVDELVKSTCELHSGSVLSMDLWLLLVIVL